jgi:hypothetical protein
MKLNRKMIAWLGALVCLAVGAVAGIVSATRDAARHRDAYTQLMWFGFYAKQDMLVEDIYSSRPSAEAVGALLVHARRMEEEKDIVLTSRMLGTNYFYQSMFFLNARLSKLYDKLGRSEDAMRHMSNAIAIAAKWKGSAPEPTAVLRAVEIFDSFQGKDREWKANKAPEATR